MKTINPLYRLPLLAVALVALLASGCVAVSSSEMQSSQMQQSGQTIPQIPDPMNIQPEGPAPDFAPDMDPQMLAVIEQLMSYEAPPFPELTAFQVRNAKLPAEAVADMLTQNGLPPQEPTVDIAHRVLPVGPEQGVLVRTYTPLEGEGPFPVIVYYHGGGWVIADLDTYEAGAAALAAKTGAVVVSVAYWQAPEHVFPTAHEDSFAAYQWVVENTAELNGDPNRIATAGESAGGNLAVAVALMARDRGVALPVHIVSVYPIADGDVQSPSYDEFAMALPLSRGFMEWFFDRYNADWRETEEPLIGLIDADLSGLPPVTIINAEIDPLASDGEELAAALEAAGIEDVVREFYPGVTHEFFGMSAVLEQAVNAQDFAASRLTEAFEMAGEMGADMESDMTSDTGTMMAGEAIVVEEGLMGPESALHDVEADLYVVSNVNGQPGAVDGNGFISHIAPDGTVAALRWIDGEAEGVTLNAPKGMAIDGDTLYVADIDTVRSFDRVSGEPIDAWPVEGATFLNDVAIGADGLVYVTDTAIEFTDSGAQPSGTAALYRFSADGTPEVVIQGDELNGPNGIAPVADGQFVVVTFGADEVYQVSAEGALAPAVTLPQGQLDGVVALDDGSLLVTSWEAMGVYRTEGAEDLEPTLVVENVNSPADIGYDAGRNHLLLPLLQENQFQIVPLSSNGG